MSKIRIKNFGPIKEGLIENDGWIDIKKVTVFIGNQGSGKSTVAKLISTFTWIEKALTRGDYDEKWFTRKNKLQNQYLTYHRIENYFSRYEKIDKTEIEYHGESYKISYKAGTLNISSVRNKPYALPQIMYVPAERNFISNVKKPKALNLTSDSLVEFVTEFDNAKNELKSPLPLPINGVEVEYNKLNDVVYIKGNDYRIKLTEASSGLQSLVPLYLVSRYLSQSVKNQSENSKELMTSEQRERFRKMTQIIIENQDLTNEQKRIALSQEAKKFNKTAYINIVEEPEQNLFPSSQWQILKSLLEFNNMNQGNKLVMTTHSPYIIGFLSIANQGAYLLNKIKNSQNQDINLNKLEKVIPIDSIVPNSDTIIYQLNENEGTISKLPIPEGIPSDKHYLNQSLRKGNEMFDSLLSIEQELCV
ncbi:MAG: ATP-binding protein [Bacteroidales bacterium]|nr:ATP-binding protein [Bacteroidales bacterium]